MDSPILNKNAQLRLVMQSDKASIYSLQFEGNTLNGTEDKLFAL